MPFHAMSTSQNKASTAPHRAPFRIEGCSLLDSIFQAQLWISEIDLPVAKSCSALMYALQVARMHSRRVCTLQLQYSRCTAKSRAHYHTFDALQIRI